MPLPNDNTKDLIFHAVHKLHHFANYYTQNHKDLVSDTIVDDRGLLNRDSEHYKELVERVIYNLKEFNDDMRPVLTDDQYQYINNKIQNPHLCNQDRPYELWTYLYNSIKKYLINKNPHCILPCNRVLPEMQEKLIENELILKERDKIRREIFSLFSYEPNDIINFYDKKGKFLRHYYTIRYIFHVPLESDEGRDYETLFPSFTVNEQKRSRQALMSEIEEEILKNNSLMQLNNFVCNDISQMVTEYI